MNTPPPNSEAGIPASASAISAHPTASATLRLIYGLTLFLLLCFAAWIRTSELNTSVNYDETLDYNAAQQPPAQIVSKYSYSLSKVLAHYTLQWEDSERGLRLPNFLAGIAAVALLLALATGRHRILSPAAAFFAAAALAVSPGHIDFSQNGRYYALMCFFWLLHVFALLRFSTGSRLYLLLYVAALVLGMQSQPFFVPYACLSWGAFVFYELVIRRRVNLRQRMMMVLPVTLCFALVMAAAWYWFGQMGDSVSSADGAASGDSHRLNLRQYWQMHQRMIFPFDGWLRILWIAVAVAGLVILLFRSTALGLIIAASLFLLPLPFLFVSVSHFFAERYFAPALVAVAICVGACLGQVVGWVLAPAGRRGRITAVLRPVAALAAAALAGALAVTAWKYIRPHQPEPYQVTMTRNDWRDFAEYMHPKLAAGDRILHNLTGPGVPDWYWVQQSQALLDFYIHRNSRPAIPTHSSLPQSNIADLHDLAAAAGSHPLSNVWFVNWKNTSVRLPRQLLALFPEKRQSKEVSLHVLGKPTRNLITAGNLEPGDYVKDPWATANANLTSETQHVFAGTRAMHIAPPTLDDGAYATFKVRHPGLDIRNAGFDAWSQDMPVGWTTNTNTTAGLSRTPGRTAYALSIDPGAPTTTVITQAVSDPRLPGAPIDGSVYVRGSSIPTITLAMQTHTRRAHISFAPASAPADDQGWRLYTATGSIPADAYADSFQLEITPATETTSTLAADPATTAAAPQTLTTTIPVAVDDLQVDVRRPGKWFDNDKIYTLSLMLKANGVTRSQKNIYSHLGKIKIYGPTGRGGHYNQELVEFEGTFDWKPIHITIDPKVLSPLPHLDWVAVMVSLQNCEGEAWVDNVQLEEGHPTPFTPDIRLPHDETIARLQAQSALEKPAPARDNTSK